MSDTLKPGEYSGGTHAERLYRWWVDEVGGVQHGWRFSPCAVDKADMRAAAAALAALADESETEVVEVQIGGYPYRAVFLRDRCIRIEKRREGIWVEDAVGDWNSHEVQAWATLIYLAGQARGAK